MDAFDLLAKLRETTETHAKERRFSFIDGGKHIVARRIGKIIRQQLRTALIIPCLNDSQRHESTLAIVGGGIGSGSRLGLPIAGVSGNILNCVIVGPVIVMPQSEAAPDGRDSRTTRKTRR